MADGADLVVKLAVIKCDYVAELPARAMSLRSAWMLTQAEDWAQPPLRELHRLAHSLAGSGATFGYADLSAHAHALELPLKALLEDPSVDRSALPNLFEALMAALAAVAKLNV
jgi:HPt (histidine-containing phosphotransfer) domain-containing protein